MASERIERQPARGASAPGEPSDEELMLRLASGHQEALGPLYSRYAPIVFDLAARTLDRGAAEEIVQEVFLAVWRKAATFTPERGSFRPWVLQIAHFRIVNELRTRSRRPRAQPDGEEILASARDQGPEPPDEAWREQRRAALLAAMSELPPAQRQALGLAFFENLTHEQVASTLNLPLGTAKTRIRSGLLPLRHKLAPVVAAVALVGALGGLGAWLNAEQAREQEDRALDLVTTSELVPLHLSPAPGMPAATHGSYRGRAGASIAVLVLEHAPPPPAGAAYQAWVRHGDRWTALGELRLDAQGHARLIAERGELSVPPDEVRVSAETRVGAAPSGPSVVDWLGH